ncbi:MAG: TolC family protein [Bdellovibrionaceae bacterium]|nr:TolC family protein [Pseudobdellovibrionaceae bacterium]MDW8190400.1 TolC family protein [Pseudobdellovibrionaceae bacterium]
MVRSTVTKIFLLIFLLFPKSTALSLTLQDLIDSVKSHYPEILAALAQYEEQKFLTTSRLGAFDFQLRGVTQNFTGYPENRWQELSLESQIWNTPIKLKLAHDHGFGSFPPYYGEKNTGSEGRTKIGVYVPLLRDLLIDSARLNLKVQKLSELSAEQQLRLKKVEVFAQAAQTYWLWRSSEENRKTLDQLVNLALENNTFIRKRVEKGDAAPLELVENQKILAQRLAQRASLENIEQQSVLQLSLFYRPNGIPSIPKSLGEPWLKQAPKTLPYLQYELKALREFPDLQKLSLELQKNQIQRDFFRWNQFPYINLQLETHRYLGILPPSRTEPYEHYLGLELSFPLLNLQARNQKRALEQKISAQQWELDLKEDLLKTKFHILKTDIEKTFEQLQNAQQELEASQKLAEAERKRFQLGGSSLFLVNVRESEAAQARLKVSDLIFKFFVKEMELKLLFNDWIEKY